jgi:hypothetical protein
MKLLHIVGTANRRISNPPEAEMMKCGVALRAVGSKLYEPEAALSLFQK